MICWSWGQLFALFGIEPTNSSAGGKRKLTDACAEATAIREMTEETGGGFPFLCVKGSVWLMRLPAIDIDHGCLMIVLLDFCKNRCQPGVAISCLRLSV